jgi:hypothetical protein
MGMQQVGLSVQNDGNISQLDVADTTVGGVYYRIEVYRCSHPAGNFGVTLSGSRAEDICGADHLGKRSNQIFRYVFAVGDNTMHKGEIPLVLEGREVFNPEGRPDGSWSVRVRDIDPSSTTFGAIMEANVEPEGANGLYKLQYELRIFKDAKPTPFNSPLRRTITEINPTLPDLGAPASSLPAPVGLKDNSLRSNVNLPTALSINLSMTTREVDRSMEPSLNLISNPDFARFRKNMDSYEDFGDFGPRAVHPGTNLIGNIRLAADSIFARQYRSGLVLLGRVVSPDMARGASEPLSLTRSQTNTRPGVYGNFVGAAINNIGIYKLGLDKVHSDYAGIPMKVAPGSRMEDGSKPIADAWRCNQTLGEVAKILYLAG